MHYDIVVMPLAELVWRRAPCPADATSTGDRLCNAIGLVPRWAVWLARS